MPGATVRPRGFSGGSLLVPSSSEHVASIFTAAVFKILSISQVAKRLQPGVQKRDWVAAAKADDSFSRSTADHYLDNIGTIPTQTLSDNRWSAADSTPPWNGPTRYWWRIPERSWSSAINLERSWSSARTLSSSSRVLEARASLFGCAQRQHEAVDYMQNQTWPLGPEEAQDWFWATSRQSMTTSGFYVAFCRPSRHASSATVCKSMLVSGVPCVLKHCCEQHAKRRVEGCFGL